MDCEKCIFAENGILWDRAEAAENGITLKPGQTGCECGRVSIFESRKEAYKAVDKPYFELTKFCNMYRTEEWKNESNKGLEQQVARKEVMPLFGIGVYDTSNMDFEDLEQTVASIREVLYPRERMKVVLSTFTKRGVSRVSDLVNRMQKDIKHSSATFHVIAHRQIRDSEVFKKLTQATHFVHILAGAKLPPDLFASIDRSFNEDLKRTIMFEGDNFSVIQKQVVNSMYLDYNDYEAMVNQVRLISKEQNVYEEV